MTATVDVAAAVLRLHSDRWVGERQQVVICVACRQPYPCETVKVVERVVNG